MPVRIDGHRLGSDWDLRCRHVRRIDAVQCGEQYLAVSGQHVDRARGRDLEQIGPQGDIEVTAGVQGEAAGTVGRRIAQPEFGGRHGVAAPTQMRDTAGAAPGYDSLVSPPSDHAHGVVVGVDVVDPTARSDRRPFRHLKTSPFWATSEFAHSMQP